MQEICGYEVKVYNLVNPGHSDSWNCMSDLCGDTLMAQVLTNEMCIRDRTRKADSDHHIAMIRKDLEKEKSEKCREVGEDYIRLISDIGNREALTRQFFLI